MKYQELYEMSKEDIGNMIRRMGANTLMQVFKHEHETFNPIDEKKCWIYEVLETEIITRMTKQ